MKQLIFLLMAAITVNATANNVDPSKIMTHLRASGTYFETPPAKGWSNATDACCTIAKFAKYDGTTYVALVSNGRQIDVEIEFDVNLDSGSVDLVVVNENNREIYRKKFTKSEKGSVIVTMEPFEEYRIRFMGRQAKGSYECRWTEL